MVTKKEPLLPPTPWSADDDVVFDANEKIIGYSGIPSSHASPALMLLWAAAPETKRQRDALLKMLRLMTTPGEISITEAHALIEECESSDAA